MNLKKIDEELYKISTIANLISFEADFTENNDARIMKNELLDYLDNKYLEVLKNILDINCEKVDDKRIYNILLKKYNYFKDLSIEYLKVLNNDILEMQVNYKKGLKKNDYEIVEKYFEKYINTYTSYLRMKYKENENLYYALISDKYDNEFEVDVIVKFCKSIIKNYKKTNNKKNTNNNVRNHDEKIFQIEETKKLMKFFGIKLENVSFYSDNFFSISPISNDDIRFTYNKNFDPVTYLKGIYHESGHILYLQGINKSLNYKEYLQPVSLAFDECIAKIFDYFIFESEENRRYIKKQFDVDIPVDTSNFIRIRSSGIYQLYHCAIRVIIENDLLNGNISPKDASAEYIKHISKVFDVKDENYDEIQLQDSQWFNGDFTYYISYVVSFLYALFLWDNYGLKNDIKEYNLDGILKRLNNIFSFGKSMDINDILSTVFNKKIDFNAYIKKLCLSGDLNEYYRN